MLRVMDRTTTLIDGASYHFRAWPDDGETFEFRAFGRGREGVLVNLTNPGPENDYWVSVDGAIRTVSGHRVFDVGDLAPGPSDPLTSRLTRR